MDIQLFSTQGSLENCTFNNCHRANISFLFPLSYCKYVFVETNQAIRDWHINKLKSEKTEKTQVCVTQVMAELHVAPGPHGAKWELPAGAGRPRVIGSLVNTSLSFSSHLCISWSFQRSSVENPHVLQYSVFPSISVNMQGLQNFETHLNYWCWVLIMVEWAIHLWCWAKWSLWRWGIWFVWILRNSWNCDF